MLSGEKPRLARIGTTNGRSTPLAAPAARYGPRSCRIPVATTPTPVIDWAVVCGRRRPTSLKRGSSRVISGG